MNWIAPLVLVSMMLASGMEPCLCQAASPTTTVTPAMTQGAIQNVLDSAKSATISPDWLYAIARQESAFASDARSSVGARGLMQLMPSTARKVAHSMGVSYRSADLYRPETPERAVELVRTYASEETAYNQELFRASLCAALTPGELRVVADSVGLGDAQLVVDTDRHMSLQLARR